jgi:GntR family transcriptional regulator, transcriptional repressor for pyruvate dehydrogenase complex
MMTSHRVPACQAKLPHSPSSACFLEFLGRFLIPRQSIRVGLQRPTDLRAYLERIQGEHRGIYAAIEAGDPSAARAAMRR